MTAFDPTALLTAAGLDAVLYAGGAALLGITIIKFGYRTIKGLLVKGA